MERHKNSGTSYWTPSFITPNVPRHHYWAFTTAILPPPRDSSLQRFARSIRLPCSAQPTPILVRRKMGLTWDSLGTYLGPDSLALLYGYGKPTKGQQRIFAAKGNKWKLRFTPALPYIKNFRYFCFPKVVSSNFLKIRSSSWGNPLSLLLVLWRWSRAPKSLHQPAPFPKYSF